MRRSGEADFFLSLSSRSASSPNIYQNSESSGVIIVWEMVYALLDIMADKFEIYDCDCWLGIFRRHFGRETTILLTLRDTQANSLTTIYFRPSGITIL